MIETAEVSTTNLALGKDGALAGQAGALVTRAKEAARTGRVNLDLGLFGTEGEGIAR